jgi:hypothetical protein
MAALLNDARVIKIDPLSPNLFPLYYNSKAILSKSLHKALNFVFERKRNGSGIDLLMEKLVSLPSPTTSNF